MDNRTMINLEKFRTPGARIFTGRDRGAQVREESNIDKLIDSGEYIEVIIPTDIITINPSFLEEFIKNVVKKLGRDNFLAKVSFVNTGEYKIESNLETAIERILRKNNALNK